MSLKAKTKRRLQKLANFLNTLPEEKFNFEDVITKSNGKACGTVACAMGWLPAISSKFAWKQCGPKFDLKVKTGNTKTGYKWVSWTDWSTFLNGNGWSNIANYFGISTDEARMLFQPRYARNWTKTVLLGNASAKVVAQSILEFIDYKDAQPKKVLVA
jgi:hypothetical protein